MYNTNTIRLIKGLNWEYQCRLLDSSGNPVDLTGFSVLMKIRNTIESPEALAILSTENGRIELFGDTGNLTLRLPSFLTSDLPRGMLSFDILFTTPLGRPLLMAEGSKIRVLDYVSR